MRLASQAGVTAGILGFALLMLLAGASCSPGNSQQALDLRETTSRSDAPLDTTKEAVAQVDLFRPGDASDATQEVAQDVASCQGCAEGQIRCIGPLSFVRCSGNAEVCPTWGAPEDCSADRVCAGDHCIPACGDAICEPEFDETCFSCPSDCGTCCPDGACNFDETCLSCVVDCGECQDTCSDGSGPGGSTTICDADLEVCADTASGKACLSALVTIPAGAFWMGCNEALDPNCSSDEVPYHEVTTPEYGIDITEVTNSQFAAFLNFRETQPNPSVCGIEDGFTTGPYEVPCLEDFSEFVQEEGHWKPVEGRERIPARGMTWMGAHAYCQWAGRHLTSNAEWEKACRGGCELYDDCAVQAQVYPWGNEFPTVCDGLTTEWSACDSCNGVCEVGAHPNGASPYGVLDMVGSVGEWMEDWASSNYEATPTDGSAVETPEYDQMIYNYKNKRGSGLGTDPKNDMRCSNMDVGKHVHKEVSTGFRCAK